MDDNLQISHYYDNMQAETDEAIISVTVSNHQNMNHETNRQFIFILFIYLSFLYVYTGLQHSVSSTAFQGGPDIQR